MKILKVKEYNRQAIKKYHKAVKNWKPKQGGFPCLAMYTFSTPKGGHRQRGYVISKDNSHYFKLTKKEVFDKFNIKL